MEKSRWASPQPSEIAAVSEAPIPVASSTTPSSKEHASVPVPTDQATGSPAENANAFVASLEAPANFSVSENGSSLNEWSYDQSFGSEDAFAQTRPPDDLFSDELTPISDPVAEALPPSTSPPRQTSQSSRLDTHAFRGRGHATSRQPRSPHPPKTDPSSVTTPKVGTTESVSGGATSEQAEKETMTPKVTAPTAAVRGPRHLTGGPAPAKLSDNELAARIAAIRLKNDQRLEKHARASADQAEALEREHEAAERAKEDRRKAAESAKRDRENRARMDVERERNRARKAKAMEGREWDAGKEEQQISADARTARRGMHGGVVGGRGGRGRDMNRGGIHDGGRSAYDSNNNNNKEPHPPKDEDFPALGAAKAEVPLTTTKPRIAPVQVSVSNWANDVPIDATPNQSWAEEMETSDLTGHQNW